MQDLISQIDLFSSFFVYVIIPIINENIVIELRDMFSIKSIKTSLQLLLRKFGMNFWNKVVDSLDMCDKKIKHDIEKMIHPIFNVVLMLIPFVKTMNVL